ncbi:two-component system response regulator [Aliarcobacter faecis]|uniref:response regulator transcription factor n=1 Tax=Aliarcobacter faecis TaxID=1564138 RepID=UPI00047A1969|nr:response regulator [Aliarcobacter faecis]QKF73155.1 two-component system response regulator [Aliarcobacter faecis]
MNKYTYNVLVVEDENQARENFVSYLSMFYENVFESNDGEEALEIYRTKKVDIILLDINIPKISGLEVARQIREKDLMTKIIVLTAHSEKSFLLEAMGLKLTKYLLKPVNRKDLKEAFELAISELKKFEVILNEEIILREFYSYSFSTKILKFKNQEINLTQKEQLLFEYLVKNRNKICLYDELLVYTDISTLDGLKNLIKRLRNKFEDVLILNISGIGYKINLN